MWPHCDSFVQDCTQWVTSKLAIDCPDLTHAALKAVQDDVVRKCAVTLKEAIPIPIEVIGCMEQYVAEDGKNGASRLFMWWWLCMVFVSLRFDDAMHVKPCELIMRDEGLCGVAWQTKVERRRKGTKFIVPKIGFSNTNWLEKGWNIFLKEGDLERDFWMKDLNTSNEFREVPADYQRSFQWFRAISGSAVRTFFTGSSDRKRELMTDISSLTAHSARVTLLDAAVHARRSTEEIGLQANWKNPAPMVLKYTRNRSSVPAEMVQQLVKEMAQKLHPSESTDEVDIDDPADTALDEVQFFLKKHSGRLSQEYRYHCSAYHDSAV